MPAGLRPESFDEWTASFYLELGKKIRSARKEKNISPASLAQCLGVSKSSIIMTETGKQRVSIDRVVRISQELGVDLIDLIPNRQRRLDESSVGRIDSNALLEIYGILDELQ